MRKDEVASKSKSISNLFHQAEALLPSRRMSARRKGVLINHEQLPKLVSSLIEQKQARTAVLSVLRSD